MLSHSVRNAGYSANVGAVLRVDGREIPLASIGPGSCSLRMACDIPVNSRAEIIVTVDGRSFVWDVVLTNGAVPFEDQIEFVAA